MCRRSAATIGPRRAPASRCSGVRTVALLLSRLRRRPRRHRLCRPARQRGPRHRPRPRVPGLCGADDRRLLDPARRRRQSDRRRARAPGCRGRRQHPRSAGRSAPTTSTSSSACCCSRRCCSTACAAATPTNRPSSTDPRKPAVKITDITIKTFRTYADRWDVGHALPMPKAELMQTVLDHRDRRGRHRALFRRRLARRRRGSQRRRPADDPAAHQGPLLVGQDPLDREMIWKWLWVANIPGERRERHRQRALGPRRPRLQPAGLQADGRRARQGQGLCLDLSQYRRAARLCRACARLQERGLPSPTRSTRTTSGTPRPARRRPVVRPTSRPTSRPATWCARRSGPTTC